MRVIHKGYAATTYGKNCLTISDPEGKIIYEDKNRDSNSYTEMELRAIIEVKIKDGKRSDRK